MLFLLWSHFCIVTMVTPVFNSSSTELPLCVCDLTWVHVFMVLLIHVCVHVCAGRKVLCAMSEGKLQKAPGVVSFSPVGLRVRMQVLGLPAYSIT